MSDLLQLPKCTGGDVEQSLEVIWTVLHDWQDRAIPGDKTRQEAHDLPHHVGDWKYKELYETADQYDDQWSDITTAMAWIREATNLPDEVEPAPIPGRLAEFTAGDFPVAWDLQDGEHTVTYGLQVTRYRDDIAACREFGECVRHSLECAGKLDPEPDPRPEMLVNAWAKHREDGNVYRLVKVSKGDELPWRFSLEWSADYIEPTMPAALKPHPLDGYRVKEENIGEVEASAFSNFDELCAFAKEVAEILNCDPATIVRAI